VCFIEYEHHRMTMPFSYPNSCQRSAHKPDGSA
jgi:hypothetical protein